MNTVCACAALLSAISCLYAFPLFRWLIKRYSIYYAVVPAVYHDGCYEFKDDYGVKRKVKTERITVDTNTDQQDISCFICYDRRNYNRLYECDQNEQQYVIRDFKKKRKMILILSIIILFLSCIGML